MPHYGGGIFSSILLLASCEQPGENSGTEKVTVAFEQNEVSVPIHGNGSASINVTPPELASEVEISVADKNVVTVEGTDINDGTISLTLKSGNSLGSTTIIALLQDQTSKCTVNISPIAVESITLNKTTLTLSVNQQEILSASYLPENATSPTIVWKSSDEAVVTVANGEVTAVSAGSATVTARCGECVATCEVTVNVVEASSLTFDVSSKELTVDEAFIVNATILPEDITYKDVEWTVSAPDIVRVEDFDAKEEDNIVSATVTALKEGDVTVTASIGGKTAECTVTVKAKEVPVEDPKIGDYFYSDGTWSDGGLVSINKDGTNPVWAETKPAPIEGKTVIGIVFQTDPARFSDEEKEAGHTRGLVVAAKSAHAFDAELTRYSFDVIDFLPNTKTGTGCYNDISGQLLTDKVLEVYKGRINKCPAFDWTTTDFSPAAPANTSGWFVPSIGQLWDMMANLGGGEIAAWLREYRTYGYDITYEDDAKMSYDPIAKLNSHFAKIPAGQKEDIALVDPERTINGETYGLTELVSSSLYDNTDGMCCVIWLGTNGEFSIFCEMVDREMVCRPVLAF